MVRYKIAFSLVCSQLASKLVCVDCPYSCRACECGIKSCADTLFDYFVEQAKENK